MTVYLCAYATRIQTWLARTPELKLLRGGSHALSAITSAGEVGPWLRFAPALAGFSVCRDAGDVDGVVVLEGSSVRAALDAAPVLLRHLHGTLPGLPWAAWVHESDNYLISYAAADRGDPTVKRWSVLATSSEVSLGKSCASCRQEHAHGSLTHPDASGPEGPDCRAKRSWAGKEGPWREVPGQAPSDFDALARIGGLAGSPEPTPTSHAVGRRDSRNHLATIVADGNQIGSLFSRLAQAGASLAELRSQAVRILDEATHTAVSDAARAASHPQAEVKVVSPHFVGGDDVLVSVPAAVAWQFASTLAARFEEEFRAKLTPTLMRQDLPPAELLDDLAGISLGIGMVFAHAKHPFADAQELAHRAMASAKSDGRGRSSVIGWMDLTAGDTYDPHLIRASDAAAELADAGLAPSTFRLPASARQQLAMLVRDSVGPDGAPSQGFLDEKLSTWGKRTGLAPGASAVDLPAVLSRARWWPGSAKDVQTTQEAGGRTT